MELELKDKMDLRSLLSNPGWKVLEKVLKDEKIKRLKSLRSSEHQQVSGLAFELRGFLAALDLVELLPAKYQKIFVVKFNLIIPVIK